MQRITTPALIIHSRNDHSVPFDHALLAQAQIKGAKLWEAQTWGHLIWLGEGAPAVNEAVINFLQT
ncbi:MAG: alpha/beta hydrolase [Caldilineaceae bacterium]